MPGSFVEIDTPFPRSASEGTENVPKGKEERGDFDPLPRQKVWNPQRKNRKNPCPPSRKAAIVSPDLEKDLNGRCGVYAACGSRHVSIRDVATDENPQSDGRV
jgi:hypothetical protein